MNTKTELKSMFTEHWKYLAVNAACELELFDKIYYGQNSMNKLLQNNNWNLTTFANLLSFLISNEYMIEGVNHAFSLTEKGNLLRKGNPEGLYYACLNWSGEHLMAWKNLKYSVETGKSSFEQIYQKPYFDYLKGHPEELRKYHQAMFEYARDDYKDLPNIIDFSIHKSIMDVGGGYGAIISLIQQKYSKSKCFLFDLKEVIEKVSFKTIETIGGNFFETIPNLADAIILSRVLHDWKNNKAKVILRNCYKALPLNGTFYVIENCADKIQSNLALLSLNMTVMCQSFERSSKQYIELCEDEGFKYQIDEKLNELQTILIFRK